MKLHGYQETAVEFGVKSMLENRGVAFWLGMGVGKTAITIELLKRIQWDLPGKTLVIGPKRVAERVWTKELRKWKAPFTSNVFLDQERRATEMLVGGADIDIINRENVPWLMNEMRDRWPYDKIVLDESPSFKSPSSQRFKALKKFHTGHTIELTGTPASNGYLDVWAQIFLMDRGERLGRTFTNYRDNFFVQGHDGFSYDLRPGAKEEIDALLADICLSMDIDLGLPPHTVNPVVVSLTANQRRQYKELEKEFLLELESGTITAANAAVMSNKLRQFCNGALYLDDQGNYVTVHDAKLDALESILEESGPVLLAYQFKSDLERIKKRFPFARHPDERGALDDFQAGKLKLLATHPESIGHGVDGLQDNACVTAWFGLPWSLEAYLQMNKRLPRQGQTEPTFEHHIIVERTIDERLVKDKTTKGTTQQSLLDAVRADLKRRNK